MKVSPTLPVTAHQHLAAAGSTLGFDLAASCEGDLVTLEENFSALTNDAVGLERSAVLDDAGLQLV